jgi:uncharacterized protein (DUF885 family)
MRTFALVLYCALAPVATAMAQGATGESPERRIAAPAVEPVSTPAATSRKAAMNPVPTWVRRSNEYAQVLITVQFRFQPESATFFGVPGYDHKVADLGPNHGKRYREATAEAKAILQQALRGERDPHVHQDLEIMIRAAEHNIAASQITERLTLPFTDVGQLMFRSLNGLLSAQTPPERRAKALDRLKAYAGMVPGGVPIAELARQRYEERAGEAAPLRPMRLEVEQALNNTDTYVEGLRKLFAEQRVAGSEAALDAIDRQLEAYAAWLRKDVLPQARTDPRLPPELYALQLKRAGIDIPPEQLIQRARLGFMETRAAMQRLAPLVAKEKGIAANDYRDVIRALKKDSIPNDRLETHYRDVIDAIDAIIRRERIVDLPERPMVMRLGTEAESASQPAPHFLPAPLVGNTGQQGQFVLPLNNPALSEDEAYDDFNFPAVAWTLSAHEGRPGHETQFTAMIERGVSLARILFAFNSVNAEGWALYGEAEMIAHEPLDGQLIALQFRLMRAARAMLDPMLNLGMIDRERAGKILMDDVVLSKAMTRQELDRYTFNDPGQAASYFYGYARILELRAETELALGERFDRLAFNNFLLDQGLMPPDLLAKAVRERFVPAQMQNAPK